MTYVASLGKRSARHTRTQTVPTLVGLSFAICGLFAPPLNAQTACEDVSGTYEVQMDLPGGGPTQMTVTLEQSDCEVTGTVGARDRTPIKDGVVEGSTASFTAEAVNRGGGNVMVIQWVVTVDGDDVIGTFMHSMFGSIELIGPLL